MTKKIRKLIALILCMAMLLCNAAIPAAAEGEAENAPAPAEEIAETPGGG